MSTGHIHSQLTGSLPSCPIGDAIGPEHGTLPALSTPFDDRCWLLELARHRPDTWRFHGLDNSIANFPARDHLPANVTLQQCDVFDVIPEELHGQFDVVHVRTFCVVVKGGDARPVA